MLEHNQVGFVTLSNFNQLQQEGKIVEGVKIVEIPKMYRGPDDPRGFLTQTLHPTLKELFGKYPVVQSYSSDTYKGVARDESEWHIHPRPGTSLKRFGQTDTWWFRGKAIVAVADVDTKLLNLFKMGFGWEGGNYLLYIPAGRLHCFLSWGGIVNEDAREVAIITNYPSRPYPKNQEDIKKVEGRVPHQGSGICFPDGTEFNWEYVRKTLGLGGSI